jgi:hypothetical protein
VTEGPALLTREVYLQYWLIFSLFPAANFTEMNHNTDGLGPVWMTASGCPSKILVGRLACVWFTAKISDLSQLFGYPCYSAAACGRVPGGTFPCFGGAGLGTIQTAPYSLIIFLECRTFTFAIGKQNLKVQFQFCRTSLKHWHIVLSYKRLDAPAFRELIIHILLDLMLLCVIMYVSAEINRKERHSKRSYVSTRPIAILFTLGAVPIWKHVSN